MRKLLTVVVPVFRNEGSLHLMYDQCRAVIVEQLKDYEYEFVFVDDGSDDGSIDRLYELRDKDERVCVIKLSRNFGQFAALNAGMTKAKGDVIVCMSADLQDPPQMIADMCRQMEQGFDIVLGCREARNDSFFRNLTAAVHFKIIRISNPTYPRGGFDFWMMNRKALKTFVDYPDVIRSAQVDILSMGFKVAHLYYERRKREIGVSQYNFKKRLTVALNQLLSTSYWPLRMASTMGFVTTILGFLYACRIVYLKYFDSLPLPGYGPIIVIQLVLGGMILFILGIIGEYIWRIYIESKGRPIFILDEVHESCHEKEEPLARNRPSSNV